MSGFRFTIPIGAFGGGFPVATIDVIPDKGMAKASTPRVLEAKFGDGYSQIVVDGINTIQEQISVTFNKRDRAEIDNIEAFFAAGLGYQPFDLISSDYREGIAGPNEKTIKVICKTYNVVYLYDNYYSCSASLERQYTPISWV